MRGARKSGHAGAMADTTERERARDLRLRCHIGEPPRAYDMYVPDGIRWGTSLKNNVNKGLNILNSFQDMTVRE